MLKGAPERAGASPIGANFRPIPEREEVKSVGRIPTNSDRAALSVPERDGFRTEAKHVCKFVGLHPTLLDASLSGTKERVYQKPSG